ncbi:MAG: hypothetical protein LBV02_08715 [Bacteroidales bacterium]|nr:hypothetical protein [Bacteroidales bacterium]
MKVVSHYFNLLLCEINMDITQKQQEFDQNVHMIMQRFNDQFNNSSFIR